MRSCLGVLVASSSSSTGNLGDPSARKMATFGKVGCSGQQVGGNGSFRPSSYRLPLAIVLGFFHLAILAIDRRRIEDGHADRIEDAQCEADAAPNERAVDDW